MRTCGDCQTCCTVAEVVEGSVNSPAQERCVHQCPTGCAIYLTRPNRCANFNCSWMRGIGNDDDRPDTIGAMFWAGRTESGVIGFVIETAPNALRTTARRAAIDFVQQMNLPLVVVSYGRMPPNDTGDHVILRKEHILRAISMRGPLVEHLSPRVSLFELARAH